MDKWKLLSLIEIKKMKIDAAIDAALSGAKAKNNIAVKALLKENTISPV